MCFSSLQMCVSWNLRPDHAWHTSHDIFTMQQVTNVNALCMVVVGEMETGLGLRAGVRIHARVSVK